MQISADSISTDCPQDLHMGSNCGYLVCGQREHQNRWPEVLPPTSTSNGNNTSVSTPTLKQDPIQKYHHLLADVHIYIYIYAHDAIHTTQAKRARSIPRENQNNHQNVVIRRLFTMFIHLHTMNTQSTCKEVVEPITHQTHICIRSPASENRYGPTNPSKKSRFRFRGDAPIIGLSL